MQANRQIKQIIGENIRQRRDELGLTRAQVARVMKIEPIYIYKWERGQHRPSDQNLVAIAQVLGHDLGWFLTDHGLKAAA